MYRQIFIYKIFLSWQVLSQLLNCSNSLGLSINEIIIHFCVENLINLLLYFVLFFIYFVIFILKSSVVTFCSLLFNDNKFVTTHSLSCLQPNSNSYSSYIQYFCIYGPIPFRTLSLPIHPPPLLSHPLMSCLKFHTPYPSLSVYIFAPNKNVDQLKHYLHFPSSLSYHEKANISLFFYQYSLFVFYQIIFKDIIQVKHSI